MNPEAVSPVDAARRFRDGALLLDCRELEELELARIDGALHIPMAEIPGRAEALPREQEIIVFCHAGVRSESVARYLTERGLPRVSNLVGGIDGWAQFVDPAIPRY